MRATLAPTTHARTTQSWGTPMSAPRVPADADDRELLRRHVAGDRDAFGELVRRHRDRLWRVALRTVGNPDDAADGLQEALLSAHRSAGGYRGDAAVTTWLHRIVVNACLDQVRRRRSRPTSPLDEATAAAATGPDPLAAREAAADVVAALRLLPEEQTAAIVLVDIEGFSVAETAEILDVPPGTVKSRCARGRARLLPLLQEGNPEPVPDVPPQTRPSNDARQGGEPS